MEGTYRSVTRVHRARSLSESIAAAGEAVFMTGLERNSDIVFAAAYAPLLNVSKVGSMARLRELNHWFSMSMAPNGRQTSLALSTSVLYLQIFAANLPKRGHGLPICKLLCPKGKPRSEKEK